MIGIFGENTCSASGNHFLFFFNEVELMICNARTSFMKKLQELLEDDYDDFESLENVEKSSYVLGSERWESKLMADVWEI